MYLKVNTACDQFVKYPTRNGYTIMNYRYPKVEGNVLVNYESRYSGYKGFFHRTFSSSYRKIGSCQCMVCKDDNAILDATINMLLLIMNILPTPSYLK